MSPCATQEQLERFLGDELDACDCQTVVTHIEECAACRQSLEQLVVACDADARRPSVLTPDERDAPLIDRLGAMGMRFLERDRPGELMTDRTRRDPAIEGSRDPDASTRAPRAFPTVAGFRILREIGCGGMGVVYEAEDEQLGRRVALKVLPAHTLIHAKQVQRFDHEARAAARLHHANIVPVFGVGQQDGHPYYVMQHIEGVDLDRVIDEWRRGREGQETLAAGALSPVSPGLSGLATLRDSDRRPDRSVARIGHQVAEALEYAHGQGILHRDIKPSNLLLDAMGNVWVADFGLAKTPEAADLTSTGDVLGTIRYMAPERFHGRCDARSDVYSLGLTLYELVALRPAYEATDRYELIEQVRRAEAARLGERAPGVARDLETIIHKAIAPEPAQRYANAAALADDLRRYLDLRPIQARRASIPERSLRWCRRNRWAAAFLLALGLGLVASTWEAFHAMAAERAARRAGIQALSQRDRAEVARNRALAAVRELLLMEYGREKALLGEELRPYRKALIEAGLRTSQELVGDLEGDRRAGYQLIEAYHALARLQYEGGRREAAIESIRKAIAIAGPFFDQERSISAGNALVQSLQLIAEVLPDREAKLAALRQLRSICQILLVEHPEAERERWICQIAVSHYNAGHYEYENGRLREAIAAFLEARASCGQLLAGLGPSDTRRDLLAQTERYLCRTGVTPGRPDEGLAAGRRAIAIYRTLVEEHPAEVDLPLQLSLAQDAVAFHHLHYGQFAEATLAFEHSRQTLEGILARPGLLVSKIVQVQFKVAEVDLNLRVATDSEPARYAELRRTVVSQSYEICDKLSLVRPLTPARRYILAMACLPMAGYRELDTGQPDLDLLRKAEHLWAEIHREEPARADCWGYLVIARQQLAEGLVARGLNEEAARWRRDSLATARANPDLLYEIALEYARFALDAGGASHQQASPATEAQRRRFLCDAVAMVREAVADGFKDVGRLHSEPLLAPIRSHPEFRALVRDLEFPADPFAGP